MIAAGYDLPGWLEFDSSLFQQPRFDLVMPHPQHIERSASVMLFCQRTRFMTLDLGYNSNRYFDPFRQRTERAAQSVQGNVR